jgi:hypothetical protein
MIAVIGSREIFGLTARLPIYIPATVHCADLRERVTPVTTALTMMVMDSLTVLSHFARSLAAFMNMYVTTG